MDKASTLFVSRYSQYSSSYLFLKSMRQNRSQQLTISSPHQYYWLSIAFAAEYRHTKHTDHAAKVDATPLHERHGLARSAFAACRIEQPDTPDRYRLARSDSDVDRCLYKRTHRRANFNTQLVQRIRLFQRCMCLYGTG